LNWYAIWTLKKLGLARHVYKIELDHLPPKPALVRIWTRLGGGGCGGKRLEQS